MGGYAAVIFGTKLKADLVISFNGQWDINDNIIRKGEVISPILHKMREKNDDGVKYFNIARSEFDYPKTVYLVSSRSPWDMKQIALLKDFKNTHIIRFRNTHHGIPFLKVCLPKIINMTFEELCTLEGREHLPILFEMRMVGFWRTACFLVRLIRKKIKARASNYIAWRSVVRKVRKG